MTFADADQARSARQVAADNSRAESAERVAAYVDRTPNVLMDAMRAAFTPQGCTPAQKRLVDNYVHARIYDTDIEIVELLAASLEASR